MAYEGIYELAWEPTVLLEIIFDISFLSPNSDLQTSFWYITNYCIFPCMMCTFLPKFVREK